MAVAEAVLFQLRALHLILTVPHEFGQFVAARPVGVSVPEFGIGLPPTVVAVRWRGTRWSFNLLPLPALDGGKLLIAAMRSVGRGADLERRAVRVGLADRV